MAKTFKKLQVSKFTAINIPWDVFGIICVVL